MPDDVDAEVGEVEAREGHGAEGEEAVEFHAVVDGAEGGGSGSGVV